MRSSRLLILRALLSGRKITTYEANKIGRTTEGGRRIRQIRETYPVLKEKIGDTRFYRYYLDPVYLEEYRKKRRLIRIWENVKSLF